MGPEQGAEGPVGHGRALSTSSTRPAGENEPNDSDVQMQQPPNEKSKQQTSETIQSSQTSPRQCEPASRATAHASTPLSRNLSSSSAVSEPANPEPRVQNLSTSGHCSSHHKKRPEPPVTRSTLSELDVSKIIHNPKLRHDINFDPELHFRPNLDGEKGRKKQERANQFWGRLKEELIEFITDRDSFYNHHGREDNWCLPALLKAVKDIIQTLVPQRDRQFLDEGLNVDLLMQQFHKGVADLEKLALWLSQVLKSHCAPMRDEWVDTMYNQLSNGNSTGDIDLLVRGMSSLLSVLEAMKLDVANHQIRCLRPVLIEGTSQFEKSFFSRKIGSRKVDTAPAKEWYRDMERQYGASMMHPTHSFGDMGIFFEGLSRLILPSSTETRMRVPLLFDEERMMKLKSDMLDMVNLEVCMKLFEDFETRGRRSVSPLYGALARSQESRFRSSTPVSAEFDFNAPLSSSRPSSGVFSSDGSEPGSPRPSLTMPSYLKSSETVESRTKTRNLYNSLVALLQSAPPATTQSSRWEAIAPSMAIQIFRFTNAPIEELPAIEETVKNSLCQTQSGLYQEVEQNFHNRLMMELEQRVREFKGLSGVSLFSVATGHRAQHGSSSSRSKDHDILLRDAPEESGIEDMATRLAHVGILHWRVWAELAYIDDTESMSLDDAPAQI